MVVKSTEFTGLSTKEFPPLSNRWGNWKNILDKSCTWHKQYSNIGLCQRFPHGACCRQAQKLTIFFNYESAPALVIVFSLCNYDSGNSTLNNTGSAISMTFITVTFLAQIHLFCLERIFSHDLKGRWNRSEIALVEKASNNLIVKSSNNRVHRRKQIESKQNQQIWKFCTERYISFSADHPVSLTPEEFN